MIGTKKITKLTQYCNDSSIDITLEHNRHLRNIIGVSLHVTIESMIREDHE